MIALAVGRFNPLGAGSCGVAVVGGGVIRFDGISAGFLAAFY